MKVDFFRSSAVLPIKQFGSHEANESDTSRNPLDFYHLCVCFFESRKTTYQTLDTNSQIILFAVLAGILVLGNQRGKLHATLAQLPPNILKVGGYVCGVANAHA
jgi:hypothetical protein